MFLVITIGVHTSLCDTQVHVYISRETDQTAFLNSASSLNLNA